MKKIHLALFVTATFAVAVSLLYAEGFIFEEGRIGYDNTPKQPWSEYRIHDADRPRPVKVTPDPASVHFTPAPKNATVLFDGSNLDQWQPTNWVINKDKNLECTGGNIMTKEEYGDFQLHLEYRSPANFKGDWGNQGNNGVLIFDTVEIQIFDNYTVNSYSDGLCGSVYGQFPPLVNACLPPGNWQTYDIFFRAPKYDAKGKMTEQARVTVLLNGQMVQCNTAIYGGTGHASMPTSFNGRKTGHIGFGGHGCPVEFRNIWVIPAQTAPSPDLDRQDPLYKQYKPETTSRIRENIEWTTSYIHNSTDTALPRAMCIGDSICNGYQGRVNGLIHGKYYHGFWASSKCVSDADYMRYLDILLSQNKFDVITFNNGLHSLLQTSTSTEEYRNSYKLCVQYLKAKCPGARIYLVTSTPVRDEQNNARAVKLNEIVKQIAKEENLPVIDLYEITNAMDKSNLWSDGVHFQGHAIDAQAKAIADAILSK